MIFSFLLALTLANAFADPADGGGKGGACPVGTLRERRDGMQIRIDDVYGRGGTAAKGETVSRDVARTPILPKPPINPVRQAGPVAVPASIKGGNARAPSQGVRQLTGPIEVPASIRRTDPRIDGAVSAGDRFAAPPPPQRARAPSIGTAATERYSVSNAIDVIPQRSAGRSAPNNPAVASRVARPTEKYVVGGANSVDVVYPAARAPALQTQKIDRGRLMGRLPKGAPTMEIHRAPPVQAKAVRPALSSQTPTVHGMPLPRKPTTLSKARDPGAITKPISITEARQDRFGIEETSLMLASNLEVVKRVTAAGRLTPENRAVAIKAFKQSIRILGQQEPNLDVAQLKLLREGRVRLRLLENSDEPRKIFTAGTAAKEGATVPVIAKQSSPAMHAVDPKPAKPINGFFVDTYDAKAEPSPIGWSFGKPVYGEPLDPYMTGKDLAPPGVDPALFGNPPPAAYKAVDVDVPFVTDALPFKTVRIPPGTAVDRLQAVLEPGEWATEVGQGGFRTVFFTHPKPPDSIVAQGHTALLKWVEANRYRTAKVITGSETNTPEMLEEVIENVARRDHAMRSADKQRAARVSYKNEPVYDVNDVTYSKHTQDSGEFDGIEFEVPVIGRDMDSIQRDVYNYKYNQKLIEKKAEATDAVEARLKAIANNKKIEEQFAREKMRNPVEMGELIGANDQADRDFYWNGLNYGRGNGLQPIGHLFEAPTIQADPFPLEYAFDYGGNNKKWNPDTGRFTSYDR